MNKNIEDTNNSDPRSISNGMKNKDLKFIFWGTPYVASKTLEILKSKGYSPLLIISSPDRPSGRGLKLTPSPVSLWAEANNIKCLKPEKINDQFIEQLDYDKSDLWQLSIVVAYGKIMPEKVINLPRLGTINIHYSLLPKYRGASPLEASLLNGDEKTGVSIQQMVFKIDSGPVIIEKEIPIEIEDTKKELKEKLIQLGGKVLSKVLPKIVTRDIEPKIQDESKATYCSKIIKQDGLLNINGDPRKNYNKYRAYYGWPGTFFFKNEKRIKITKARYENNKFIIEKIIPENKKEIDFNILK